MKTNPERDDERDLTRRSFLRLSAAAGLAATFGSSCARADGGGQVEAGGDPGTGSGASEAGGHAASGKSAGDLVLRAIPSSGQEIPAIGLGTARTFDVDPDDEGAMEPLRGVMRNFYEGGGRLVDSSPMYGRAEAVVGRLARDLEIADELFMATKVWTRGRDEGIEQMKRSRELMGGGRLELIQVHNLVDLGTHLQTLRRWREEEKVRYIGVTHYTVASHDDLTAVVESEPIDFVQLNYNIAVRDAEERLLPAAADHGVATLINEPFEKGQLFRRVRGHELPAWAGELGIETWAQYFLKFIVSHPAVTAAIPATSDPEHAADNIGAARGPLPNAEERERMARHFASL